MSKYLLWRRGIKSPTAAILTMKELDEWDRKNKISEPIKLKEDEENMSVSQLIKIYEAPVLEDLL